MPHWQFVNEPLSCVKRPLTHSRIVKIHPFRHPLWQAVGALGLGLLLGTIGPFGTFADLGAGARYVYWVAIVAANWLQIVLCLALLAWLPASRGWPPVALAVAAAALAALPATAEVVALEHWLRAAANVDRPSVLLLYGYVLLLSVVVTVPMTLLLSREPPATAAAPATVSTAPGRPAFHRRIPAALGDALLCLAMEDHYVRVYTDRGDALVLLRLRDAIDELDGADGMQVHRSYWVARNAVEEVKREGRRARLLLKNGVEVPVSRTYLPALREAGWL